MTFLCPKQGANFSSLWNELVSVLHQLCLISCVLKSFVVINRWASLVRPQGGIMTFLPTAWTAI